MYDGTCVVTVFSPGNVLVVIYFIVQYIFLTLTVLVSDKRTIGNLRVRTSLQSRSTMLGRF